MLYTNRLGTTTLGSAAPTQYAILYKHADGMGQPYFVYPDTAISDFTKDSEGIPNDAISSLYVPPNMAVYLYADKNFAGMVGYYPGGPSGRLHNLHRRFNDHPSSVATVWTSKEDGSTPKTVGEVIAERRFSPAAQDQLLKSKKAAISDATTKSVIKSLEENEKAREEAGAGTLVLPTVSPTTGPSASQASQAASATPQETVTVVDPATGEMQTVAVVTPEKSLLQKLTVPAIIMAVVGVGGALYLKSRKK